MSGMKIINVTEIAVIMGLNKYQNISDVYLRLYSKYYKDDYNRLLKDLGKQEIRENNESIIKDMESKYGLKVDMKECLDNNKLVERNWMKKELKKGLDDKEMTEDDRVKLYKAIDGLSNTVYGQNREGDILSIYCNAHKKKCRGDVIGKFVMKDIQEGWKIGGKVDGVTEDGILVEIKNRAGGRFFKRLYDYERIQIQAYMNIFGLKEAHLVEAVGDKINMIEDKYSETMWKDMETNLKSFAKMFDKTSQDKEFIEKIMKTNDAKIRNAIIDEKMNN